MAEPPDEPPLPPEPPVRSDVPLPGDANRDFKFDQLDLIQVQIASTYRTGKPAGWAEGDWNGDGVFDQLDVIAALQTGNYLRGSYRTGE